MKISSLELENDENENPICVTSHHIRSLSFKGIFATKFNWNFSELKFFLGAFFN